MDESKLIYEGKTEREILIDILVDLGKVKQTLVGNGQEGLCAQVRRHEHEIDDNDKSIGRFATYFAIISGVLIIGVPLLAYILK